MGAFIDEAGNRYGRLLVLKEEGRQIGLVTWKCQCDCGKITVVTGNNLRSGITRSCSCLQKDTAAGDLTIDEIGNVHGRLTVIEKAESHNGYARWVCRCECGKTTEAAGSSLRSGGTRSCGCLGRENASMALKMFGIGTKRKSKPSMAGYMKRTEKRGLPWDLSSYRFEEMIRMPCHYCGAEAKMYNGIDRMDSNDGYTENNVVPCCSICNLFKRDLPYEGFLELIRKIAQHMSTSD